MKTKFTLLVSVFFLLIIGSLHAQYEVKGKLIDKANGEPLIFASVLEKGTPNGVNTDFDGKFSMIVSDSSVQIQLSYTGYRTLELTAYEINQKQVIKLDGAGELLSEVVVTGSRKLLKKSSVTASVSTITSSEMRRGKNKRKSKKNSYQYSPPPISDNRPINVADRDRVELKEKGETHSGVYENRFEDVNDNPFSTFSIDVDGAAYSLIRNYLKRGQMPSSESVRIEEMINYFDYDYPQPEDDRPFQVITELSEAPWNEKNKLLHIGLQGKEISKKELPSSNLVFLVDVSGSMNSGNKLPLVQESLKLLVDELRADDKVAIVVYAGAAGLVLPSTKGSKKETIKKAINKLRAGGSTAGGAGINLAYKIARENFIQDGTNRVILATDGDFNVGISSDKGLVELIEKQRQSGVFLSVLGFGMGNYKDGKMQKLANKGNGNHAYIDQLEEAKKVLVKEFGGTLFTIAKDVKIQIEFDPNLVKSYRLIGYENRMLNKEDFDDDTKDAGELGSGHTVTAIYEIVPKGGSNNFVANTNKMTTGDSKASIGTIKLRYKKPDVQKSELVEEEPIKSEISYNNTSANFRWAAAVTEFGLILKKSNFKGKASYDHCLKMAKSAKGKDKEGYKSGMIKLIEEAKKLDK